MKYKITLLLTVLLSAFSITLFAQDGANDASFNPTDIGFSNGVNGVVYNTVVQPDGKLIAYGGFSAYQQQTANGLVRINTDESLDTTFNCGTGVNNSITDMVLLPDGKIIIVGSFTTYNGMPCGRIARLNIDGSLDTTFNTGGAGANEFINAIAVAADGKIVIAGYFTAYNGLEYTTIARLNSNGTADATFNPGAAAGLDNALQDVAVQADGKIIAVGTFTVFNGFTTNRLVRLNQDGNPDTGFVHNYPGYILFNALIQNDGKIIVTGYSGTESEPANIMYRYNTNGSTDTSLVLPVEFDYGTINAIALQADDKSVLSIINNSGQKKVIRLSINGSVDASFAEAYPQDEVYSIAIASNGKIFAAGDFVAVNNVRDNSIIRLNANGTKDTAFDLGGRTLTGADATIYNTVKQPDNKIIIAGDFYSYNGTPRRGIARLTENGDLDAGFNPGTGVNGRIGQVQIGADGKIIISGDFTTYNNVPVNHLARLNADGSLDTSFTAAAFTNIFGTDYSISALAFEPDGKLLVGGIFITYNNVPCNQICRLNTDGTLDSSFDTTFMGTFDKEVNHIIVLPAEQKILVASGNSYTAIQNAILKVDYNGTLDPSFTTIASQWVRDIDVVTLQYDGKILASGQYINESESFNNRFMRFNADGTPDVVFYDESVFESPALYKVLAQPDGKIIVTGGFGTGFEPLPDRRITRLNNDGTHDDTFDPGESTNNVIFDMTLQGNNVVIAGNFIDFDGVGRNRIARLNSSGALNTQTPIAAPKNNLVVYKENNALNVKASQNVISSVAVYDLQGRLLANNTKVNGNAVAIKNLPDAATILIVKVTYNNNTTETRKIYY